MIRRIGWSGVLLMLGIGLLWSNLALAEPNTEIEISIEEEKSTVTIRDADKLQKWRIFIWFELSCDDVVKIERPADSIGEERGVGCENANSVGSFTIGRSLEEPFCVFVDAMDCQEEPTNFRGFFEEAGRYQQRRMSLAPDERGVFTSGEESLDLTFSSSEVKPQEPLEDSNMLDFEVDVEPLGEQSTVHVSGRLENPSEPGFAVIPIEVPGAVILLEVIVGAVAIPMLSDLGLIFLVTVLLAVGIWLLRRREERSSVPRLSA